jgi:CelD/BcsL family acetyltransferase involved in cellulose biosynthesis
LPGRLRNTLQRSRKKADKAGKLEFELIRDSDQLDSILSLVFDIEYKSWKGRNGTAMKCQPEVENFYRTLAHWAAAQKNLHIFILKLDKIPIAATFCLSFGNTVFLLKIGYDESFSKFSPGSLLHCEIFEYLSQAQQFTIYNFLGATELWKMEWTEKTSDYGFIRVYPKTIRGWSGYMFKYGWKNIIKRILRKVYALTDSNRHH